MRTVRLTLVCLLCCAMLLTGCGTASAPAETPRPTTEQQADLPAVESGSEMRAEVTVPDHGMLIHMERMSKEAFDPETGTNRILTFAWDNVRVDSELAPEAAFQLLPYRAVGVEHGLLLALRLDRAEWNGKTVDRCLAAISPTPVSGEGGYQALVSG